VTAGSVPAALASWLADVAVDGLSIPWPTMTAGGLLGLCVLLILTGRLVTRSQLKDMQAERDAWRQLALQTMSQNGQLMVGAVVASDVLATLPGAARKPEDSS
jgi:hypothetical protein